MDTLLNIIDELLIAMNTAKKKEDMTREKLDLLNETIDDLTELKAAELNDEKQLEEASIIMEAFTKEANRILKEEETDVDGG